MAVATGMLATSAWAASSILGDDREARTGTGPAAETAPTIGGVEAPTGGVADTRGALPTMPTISETAPTGPPTTAPATADTPTAAPPAPSAPPAPVPTTSDPDEGTATRPAPGAVLPPSIGEIEDTGEADAVAASQAEAGDLEQQARQEQEVWPAEPPFFVPSTEPFVPVGPEYGDDVAGG